MLKMFSINCVYLCLILVIVLRLCVVYCAIDVIRENTTVTGRGIVKGCEKAYSINCFKLDVASYVEKISDQKEFNVLPGLSVVRDNNSTQLKTDELISEMTRSFPNDPDKRIDGFLLSRLTKFLETHTLKLKLIDDNTVNEARSIVTGRQKGGGKKNGGFMAAALLYKGTLAALALGALAALAGKALITALLALKLAALLNLKSLASSGHKDTTYEVITKHSDDGGYRRSGNIALPEYMKNNY